ncbi:MAG: beta-lactamase family protein, partial [Asticcacaulis sp.]|nr:beta-lactamase family protein [Asticcacaulis sp.]
MSRRSALKTGLVGLVLLGLAGSATQVVRMASKSTSKPTAKTQLAAVDIPRDIKDWPSLDALGDGMVKRKLTPGLSLSVMRDGTLIYSKGFGVANVETGADMTPVTGSRVASITKQFTAAAILVLAEQGKLRLDDPLALFLPDFPRAGDITLRQMLSHTAGLSDYINGQSHDILVAAQTRDYTADELLPIIKSRTPLYRFQPGTSWLYSNSGFALLGIVVEKVSGLAFADFCDQHLFQPAGLRNTTIDKTCTTANVCSGYTPNYLAPHGFDLNLPVSPSFIGGAGAIRATTEDLCLWHCALLNGKVLKPHSVLAMTTPTLLKNGTPAYEHRGPEAMEYGLGMGIGTLPEDDLKVISHGGRVNGFTGHLRSVPETKLTVAILYNSDGGGAPGFSAAQKALRTEATKLGLKDVGVT